jgi:hypothetical protein
MSSSRRAQTIRQWAVISGQESEQIPFSPLLLARRSRRYLEELVLGSGPGDIVIDSTFDRDSVIQFISTCEGADFSLTLSNVFEIALLCDEWSVFGKSIRQKVIEFIKHPPSGQSIWLRRLLFRLGRGLPTSEAEDLLRCNLVNLVCDSAALNLSAAILSRIIDFRSYEAGTCTTATSSMSHRGRSRRRQKGQIHTRGHMITMLIVLRRMQLIWKQVQISSQLTATRKKIFRTQGTIGCATISMRGEFRQLTTQSALVVDVRAIGI